MKILFTGATSFTGYWIVQSLIESEHKIIAPIRFNIASYQDGMRKIRLQNLLNTVEIIENCSFGNENFIKLIENNNFDLLCHHAACVKDYRSPDFDPIHALNENTNNLKPILTKLANKNLQAVILTGSVFEQNEGAGDNTPKAFSPYGLSKGLTYDVFKYYTALLNIPLFKFTIPNPFGPLEEERFCSYLHKKWSQNETAIVSVPHYIRDNIHVSLLAQT